MAGCGIEHYLTSLRTPCAYYNSGSGLGEELNESCLDCKSMHPAGPKLSEVVLLPSGFQLLLASRLPLGSCQTSRRSNEILQRVRKVTRQYRCLMRQSSIHTGWLHSPWLNRHPSPGCRDPVCLRRVTWTSPRCVEEIPRVVSQRQR